MGFYAADATVLKSITTLVEALGWKKFCLAYTKLKGLIYKFYASKVHRRDDYILMEGQHVDFNAHEINGLYDLPCDAKVEGNRTINESTNTKINDALNIVMEPGVEGTSHFRDANIWRTKIKFLRPTSCYIW